MNNSTQTLEQMIADRASIAINQLVDKALADIEQQKRVIEMLDEVAYPANMIAQILGKGVVTIHKWFDSGKLTNVSSPKEHKKAKFKEFKNLIGGK